MFCPPLKYIFRNPGSSKVEEELDEKEGEWDEAEPEKEEDSLK